MSVVAETLGVARSNLAKQTKLGARRPRGRPPLPDAAVVEEIKAVIASMPTYGYRRVQAVLARRAHEQGRAPPNHKRVYRVMKAHGLLLQRHAGGAETRRHDGRIASRNPICAGARMGSSSVVTMARRCGSRLPSIVVTARRWAMSLRQRGSRARTSAISCSARSSIASGL